MLVRMVVAPALNSCIFRKQIDPVCAASQGDFPQGGQVFYGKEMNCRTLCLSLPVDISTRQPLQQLCRFNIHKINLSCLIEDGIRDALFR